MTDTRIFMIAGLGNPGEKYSRTRHNIGFMVVDEIASKKALKFSKSRFDAEYLNFSFNKEKIFLVKPQSYMNNSGFPIQKLTAYFKIGIPDIIIVHDDIDLPSGRIRISKNRGHGGHNGVRSIIRALGTKDFIRVRIGIADPQQHNSTTGYVLGKFSKKERANIDKLIEKAADAAMAIVGNGIQTAMNHYNAI